MTHALAFFAAFTMVALKSFQQLNVMRTRYDLVIPTSFFLASAEVGLVGIMAHEGLGWIVLPIGAGAGLGCCFSMKLHGYLSVRKATITTSPKEGH